MEVVKQIYQYLETICPHKKGESNATSQSEDKKEKQEAENLIVCK